MSFVSFKQGFGNSQDGLSDYYPSSKNLVQICFKDESLMEIRPELLKKLDYFQDSQIETFYLDICPEDFELLIALVIEEKNILELRKPVLREHIGALTKNLIKYAPSKLNPTLKKIREDLQALPLENAKLILEKLEGEEERNFGSLLIEIAEQIFLESLFFERDELATERRADIIQLNEQLKSASLSHLRVQGVDSLDRSAFGMIASREKHYFNVIIQQLSETIEKYKNETNVESASITKLAFALKRSEEAPSFSCLNAFRAKVEKRILEYREFVLKVFQKMRSDMSREDLLEYLVGPKAYLLDYYGFKPNIQHSRAYFSHSSKNFVYRLSNKNPSELEDEIRNDLANSKINCDLPRLIEESFLTSVIDPEVEKNKSDWLNALLPLRDDSELKKVLIQRGCFHKFNIQVENLTLHHTSNLLEDKFFGTLNYKGKEIPFYFRSHSFSPVIPETRISYPDSNTTEVYLANIDKPKASDSSSFPFPLPLGARFKEN